jgi:spermidine synthase
VLLAVVSCTGAAVLIIEVVAMRVLSPHFGSTIFTASSVISVILAALSIGYYAGGRFADRHPSERWFYCFILLGGLSVLLQQMLSLTLLRTFSVTLSIVSGPLISALVLFTLPALLLGMLSPFVIALQKQYAQSVGVGSIAGEVFFWSTIGSIAGSLLAGFVLIPRFGVHTIMLGTGSFLTLLGLLGMVHGGARKEALAGGGVFVLLVSLVAVLLPFQFPPSVVYGRDGVYERVVVADFLREGRPARVLMQDSAVSGGVYLDDGDMLFPYPSYYALYRLAQRDVLRTLTIGAGMYAVPMALLRDLPDAQVDVVEIEPILPEIGRRYFSVPDDQRLRTMIDDGRRFLAETQQRYDFIFSDVYASLVIPMQFATKEFFALARDRLTPGGVFFANIIGSLAQPPPSLLLSEMRTFLSVFPQGVFFAVESPDSDVVQNVIFLGVNDDREIDVTDPAIADSADPFLRSLQVHRIDISSLDLSPHPMLTDDYAPVEYLATDVIRRIFQRGWSIE